MRLKKFTGDNFLLNFQNLTRAQKKERRDRLTDFFATSSLGSTLTDESQLIIMIAAMDSKKLGPDAASAAA